MASFQVAADLLTAIFNGITSKIRDKFYPVGSIYISASTSVNPATLFGGTWVRVQDGFLFCSASTSETNVRQGNLESGIAQTAASSGSTGGPSNNSTSSTAITIDQMPAHRHGQLVTANPNTGGTGVRSDYNGEGQGYSGYTQGIQTEATGGGQGHTHSLNSHTHSLNSHKHSIPYTVVVVWRRTA